jgi:hypothetical protein
MEDRKFKIGDLVRITKRIGGHCFEIGEVVRITRFKGNQYKAEGKKDFWFVQDEEIELVVDDKPDFKVGDEVTILSWYFKKIRTPQKGVIVGIDFSDTNTPYQILLEEDHKGRNSAWYFRKGEIELVVDDKPDFKSWLDEKITTLIQLDTDTSKLQEVKRIFNLYLNSLK